MSLSRHLLFFVALAFSIFLTNSSEAKTSTLRILTENWPPVSYEENGKAQGMAVELVQTIQKDIGSKTANVGIPRLKIDGASKVAPTTVHSQVTASSESPSPTPIEVVPWVRGYKFLQDVPNTLLFTVIRTPEREKLFTMLGPVARGNISVFALAKPKKIFASEKSAKESAVIAVTRGTAFESSARNLKYKNIIDVRDTETALRLLAAGRVDFICDDSLTVLDILRKLNITTTDIKTVLEVETYDLYLGFSPGTDPNVVRDWKKSLESLKKNGQYAAIYHKWFRDLKPPTSVEVIGLAASKF